MSVALGAGAAVAVLAATSDGSSPSPLSSPRETLAQAQEGQAWLGIMATSAGDGTGVLTQQVFVDSPAHEAGLRRGDLITAVGDADVANVRELKAALAGQGPGDLVTLTLQRDDEEIRVDVTLGERPDPLHPVESKGPFADLGEIEFADILNGQVTVTDDDGDAVTINMAAGEVESISEQGLTVTLNGGGERTFKLAGDTVVARERLDEGAPVVVVTVGDSDEARMVIDGRVLEMLPVLSELRERLHQFPRMGVPQFDLPRRHFDIPCPFGVPEHEPFPPLEEGFHFEFEVSPDEAAVH